MQQPPDQAPRMLFPLSKFSHTTTLINHSGPFVWTHVNGNDDLFCELEKHAGIAVSPPSLIMKVVHKRRTLERIDLAHYVRGTRDQAHAFQNGSLPKPPFAVVVKLPCLAIKYLQTDTHVGSLHPEHCGTSSDAPSLCSIQIRRFQIKFAHECDYYTTLSMLSGIDCPLTEGAMQALHRPPSSASWASVPTVHMANVPSRGTGAVITPESNAPVPLYPMTRTVSGFEKIVSNSPSSSSNNVHLPVSGASQVPSTFQDTSAGPESLPRDSPRALIAQAGNKGTQEAPSRLSTAPVYHDQELNQMLPPKRDLPFTTLKSKMSRADTSSRRSSQQLVPESSFAESNALDRHDSFMSNPPSQQLIQTQPYPEETHSTYLSPQLQATQPYPESNTTTQQPVSGSSVAIESTESPQINIFNNKQTTQVRHAAQSIPVSVEEQLSLYVNSPTPERVTFLENWMCELIEDDNFMTLCQDVEGTWRRFAFGVKQ
ncbi:uncharacterized protein N7482_004307 [Penicillium canariense]|uniref:Uncharacterized protein n=1 Tax=Penicillium canariense TaxID=189055 RepID=A0A9W9LQE2_9EURO|nr:uncharacterized protein N7482_004307 [Penicillium canariense]KAJ5168713.1 hypothetical protein N7482_004307 [Penicillium canariense]